MMVSLLEGTVEEISGEVSGLPRVAYLFQPDTVLPIQHFDRLRTNIYLQSEKRLMLAVLEDAVACFQKYHSVPDKKGKKLFHEADEWFRSKDDNWPFSFENICEVLAMNSDYLRRGLLEWKEKQPLSRRLGPRKGTKRFGKKARVLRGIEQQRLSEDQRSLTEFWGHFRARQSTRYLTGHRAPAEVGISPM